MDRETVSSAVDILSTLTLGGQALAGILVLLLIYTRVFRKKLALVKMISQNGLSFAFIVATVATLGSLFLSEIAHFTPCKLCWFQRIFMYPQVVILGIALIRNDLKVRVYSLALAGIGLAIAIYHYLLQMFPTVLPCTDEVASCAVRQFARFGYVTIPMMALTAFVLIILFLLFINTPQKKK